MRHLLCRFPANRRAAPTQSTQYLSCTARWPSPRRQFSQLVCRRRHPQCSIRSRHPHPVSCPSPGPHLAASLQRSLDRWRLPTSSGPPTGTRGGQGTQGALPGRPSARAQAAALPCHRARRGKSRPHWRTRPPLVRPTRGCSARLGLGLGSNPKPKPKPTPKPTPNRNLVQGQLQMLLPVLLPEARRWLERQARAGEAQRVQQRQLKELAR